MSRGSSKKNQDVVSGVSALCSVEAEFEAIIGSVPRGSGRPYTFSFLGCQCKFIMGNSSSTSNCGHKNLTRLGLADAHEKSRFIPGPRSCCEARRDYGAPVSCVFLEN